MGRPPIDPNWKRTEDLPKPKRKYTRHNKVYEPEGEKVEVLLNKRQVLEIIIRILQKELAE